jgi:YCII-related domain
MYFTPPSTNESNDGRLDRHPAKLHGHCVRLDDTGPVDLPGPRSNESLAKAGVLLAGEGPQPSSKGARVKFSGASRTVVNGPFPDTEDLVAGFWMLQVASREEALEWVKRCPNPMSDDCEI